MAKGTADDIGATFHDLVNMTPQTLERWLATAASRAVGYKTSEGTESRGHRSGREIVLLLRKRPAYDEHDRATMHRVVGFIKRHLAQRPEGEISDTRWAASLKNWGHDPTKDRASG